MHIALLYNSGLSPNLPRSIFIVHTGKKSIVNKIPYPKGFDPFWSDLEYDQDTNKLFILHQPSRLVREHELYCIKNITSPNHEWIKLHENVFGPDCLGYPQRNWKMWHHWDKDNYHSYKSLRKMILHKKEGLLIFAAFIMQERVPDTKDKYYMYDKEQVYIYKYDKNGQCKATIPTQFIITNYYQQYQVVSLYPITSMKFMIINQTTMSSAELSMNGDVTNIRDGDVICKDWECGVVNCRDNLLMGAQKDGLWINIIDFKRDINHIKQYQIAKIKNKHKGEMVTILMHDDKWRNKKVFGYCLVAYKDKICRLLPPQYLIHIIASYYNEEHIALLINKKILNMDTFVIERHYIETMLECAEEEGFPY